MSSYETALLAQKEEAKMDAPVLLYATNHTPGTAPVSRECHGKISMTAAVMTMMSCYSERYPHWLIGSRLLGLESS